MMSNNRLPTMSTPDSTPPSGKKSSPLLLGCIIAVVVVIGVTFLLVAKACTMVGGRLKEITTEMEKNPARAAALLALRMSPDIEVLSTDDAKNSVTFKDKKSGKVTTMSFDDIAKGKLTVKDSEGHEVIIDASKAQTDGAIKITGPDGSTVIGGSDAANNLPDWVPNYPGAKPGQGGMKAEKDGVLSGLSIAESTDPAAKVKEFYETKLKADGYQVESVAIGADAAQLTAKKATPKSAINITISTDSGKTNVMVTYERAK
jgi:hypothetical protein